MSEKNLARPPVKIGLPDWSTYPDELFSTAFDVVQKGKVDKPFGVGLEMVMSLKRAETIVMAQQSWVNSQEEYLRVNPEDAMFNYSNLAENQEELRVYETKKDKLLAKLVKQIANDSILQESYQDAERIFTEMLNLITPSWEGMSLTSKAAYQHFLLYLLRFYFKNEE